jgi:hypothetical protein
MNLQSPTVTYRIVRVAPFSTARIIAVLCVLAALPYAFFAQIPIWVPREHMHWVLVVIPVLYGLLGFVLTLAGAALYNLFGPRVGGFVYTVRLPAQSAPEGEMQ